jgi:ligand-binding sensor domain-containing protein
MKKLSLLWVVVLGWAGYLQAQQRPTQFEFQHIQEKDGLSFNSINCFWQDHDGFLWIGTKDGANRFDGKHFFHFKHQRNNPNSLVNNTVQSICEDQTGNIWMATGGGISCYEKQTGRFRNFKTVDGRALGLCSNVVCDRNGDIWFSSFYSGLFRYATRTSRIQHFPFDPQPNPLTTTRIPPNGLLVDPRQNGLWIADRREGLHYFDIGKQRFTSHRDNPQQLPIFKPHYITALAIDGDRLLFVDDTDRRIIIYDLLKQRVIRTITPVSRTQRDVFEISTLFVDRRHNIWVSSLGNVSFFIEAETHKVTELFHNDAKNTSIAGDFFWAAWQHPDGSVWLGTVNGISCANPERAFYEVYDLGALFPPLNDERGILSFAEDPDSSWWFGTSIRGLLHYSPETNQLAVYRLPNHTTQRPYGEPIAGIFSYKDDLLIGTENALYRFNRQTKTFTDLPLPAYLRQHNVYLHTFLLEGDRLWLAGGDKLMFCYTITTGQWRSYPILSASKDPKFRVRLSLVDQHGAIWLDLYPEGFARLDRNRGQFLVDKLPEGDEYENSISSFTEDRAGNFWLTSTGYGLLRYDPRQKKYTLWSESEGLAFDHSGAVLPDRFGNIWVAGRNKFSVFMPEKNRFQNFTLPLNEANIEYENRLFPLRNGHILATLKGYAVDFAPEKRTVTTPKETVLLNSLALPDTAYLLRGASSPEVRLKATDNSFTVQYSVLNPLQENQYVYQLEGYDDRWLPAGLQRQSVYTKLPGGNYRFNVRLLNGDPTDETPVSSLVIHIDTLFYKTTGFWLLLIVIIIGLSVWFIRYRTQQTAQFNHLHMQAARLERDKTQIQYQNLINHLNPHFLFNSLTSLSSLIIKNPDDASVFLRKLSLIYRYILQNKDREVVSLIEELDFVQHYMDLQKTRFGDGIQFLIEIKPADRGRQIVPVTIQNLLENAIKHNTISKEEPLVIRIYSDGESLIVTNTLYRKQFVSTSNKQGLASLQSLYRFLSRRSVSITETETEFIVKVPLL